MSTCQEFLLIAEAGILERQAVLLCESVRRFATTDGVLTVVSPRPDRRPEAATLRALSALGADYHPLDLHSACPEYGPSYRIAAAAWCERRPGPEIIVQLDSDTLFLGEPDFSLDGADFLARPVDLAGLSTTGDGCVFDPFWRELCALAGVDYDDLPFAMTTIDLLRIRANYNAGLLVARRSAGLFQRTEVVFGRLVEAGLKPLESLNGTVRSGAGLVSAKGSAYWGTSQAAFSAAAASLDARVRILPAPYNVPLHLLEPPQSPPEPWIHVHYHWLAADGGPGTNRLTDPAQGLPAAAVEWLRPRLPLSQA